MGSVIKKAMEDNMKKQQEIILETQRSTMERQIQKQNEMSELQLLMQKNKSRDRFLSFCSFYAVAVAAMIAGPANSKTTRLVPMLPLMIVLTCLNEMACYTKLKRMRLRDEADRIMDMMDKERGLLAIPHGVPTMHKERGLLAIPQLCTNYAIHRTGQT